MAKGHAMKTLSLEIVGILKRPAGWEKGALTLEVPTEASIAEALTSAGYDGTSASRIQVLSGGKTLSKDAIPEDGATLTLYLPVGGG